MNEDQRHEARGRERRSAGQVIAPGVFVELTYRPANGATRFAVFERGKTSVTDRYQVATDTVLVPYSGSNNLLRHGVVLFPEGPEEYGTGALLAAEVRAFIQAYVRVSDSFAAVATYYVLLSWIYDAYRELPYLRVRGDYGSGKTRLLQVVGSVCYKPIFASGASTVAPLFHILDSFGGTLILDEGDFDRSDEKADIVKILNNGNAEGFPVLRMEGSREGYVNPRAFTVFGPKIIATRSDYADPALESRCISEDMRASGTPVAGIPITLPESFPGEALRLRNKLLLFRFRLWGRFPVRAELSEPSLEPRINQVFAPLLALANGLGNETVIRTRMRELERDLRIQRGLEVDGYVLEVIVSLVGSQGRSSLSIAAIAEEFNRRHATGAGYTVTNKTIGFLARRRLQLKTQKSHGVFVIPESELRKLPALCERYGLVEQTAG